MSEPTTEAGRQLILDCIDYDNMPPDRIGHIRRSIPPSRRPAVTFEMWPAEAVVLRHALMSYRNQLAQRDDDPYPMTDGFELVAADALVERLDILSKRLLTEKRRAATAPSARRPAITKRRWNGRRKGMAT